MSAGVHSSSDEARSAPSGSSDSLAVTLFASVVLVYLSLSPGFIAQMGYLGEEMRTGNLLLSRWAEGSRTAVEWARHGVLPVLLDLPLLAVGRVLEQRAGISQEHVLSVSPVLWTS